MQIVGLMTATDKRTVLLELAIQRKQARWDGYYCLGDYHDGVYECDFVSPYTKTAGNIDADIFVMLQDWSSHDSLSLDVDEETVALGYTPNLPTSVNLMGLLRLTFDKSLNEVYGTNLFPFIKCGNMSARIPRNDLVRAARDFGLPQIQIVDPKLVICLGLQTFNALRVACKLPASDNMSSAIESPFPFANARIWCQAHTGVLGQNTRNRGGVNRVSQDWQRMKAELDQHLRTE